WVSSLLFADDGVLLACSGSLAIREELEVEPLLLHIERSLLRWLGTSIRCLLDAFLGRCSRHVPPGGGPGHAGGTIAPFPPARFSRRGSAPLGFTLLGTVTVVFPLTFQRLKYDG
ncbi:hypothetical protein XENORESO_002989, partial [Xenotaenia resolanae]